MYVLIALFIGYAAFDSMATGFLFVGVTLGLCVVPLWLIADPYSDTILKGARYNRWTATIQCGICILVSWALT